ncbi:aspartyl protease family protein 1-like [Euphorbia lathyris]|uniref:aspartyl protease family protein 1-like n=1 Tax=Euphorbia lathyris TaxID=212925 RepID=UPI003313CFB8
MASSSSIFFSSLLILLFRSCSGFGTYGFDIHHRFSDPVKGFLSVDDLPEKGSPHYYATMAHRDRLIHGRKLASATNNSVPLAFSNGNETYRISSLGFLHYANISVGTPSLSFLVALDTGSDLFWLPCDCSSCVHGLESQNGQEIKFNIYSTSTSSTGKNVTCNSALCARKNRCSSVESTCPYQVIYLSNGTSSNGVLVEDVLHLTTDNTQSKSVNASITFGCGQVQTGSFLDGAAPNGLLGLGMTNVSVPSTLAREGYTSNSFSMCFGPDGIGRISFGDTGISGQGETPFNLREAHPTYNISITNIDVGGKNAALEFYAIFDSGTSFTYLNDPAYTLLTETFNNQAKEKRYSSSSTSTAGLPFEYCYEISSNQTDLLVPTVNLMMKGASQFNVTDPVVIVALPGDAYIYCLGVVKSGDVNIIGQNFMTGYRIIFDRERNLLGWKASDCYDDTKTNNLPINPLSPGIPPATAINPEATANNTEVSRVPSTVGGYSTKLNPLTFAFMMLLIPLFIIV